MRDVLPKLLCWLQILWHASVGIAGCRGCFLRAILGRDLLQMRSRVAAPGASGQRSSLAAQKPYGYSMEVHLAKHAIDVVGLLGADL